MDLLDIGGGFPGSEDAELKFEEVSCYISLVVQESCHECSYFVSAVRHCGRVIPRQITAVINPALDKYFPADGGVRVIAEPGRFYVASAYTLVVNIIAKKVIMNEEPAYDGNSRVLEHELGFWSETFVVVLTGNDPQLCYKWFMLLSQMKMMGPPTGP